MRPAGDTVATSVLVLLQVPPVVVSENVVVPAVPGVMHIVSWPVIAPTTGSGFTVIETVAVAKQP